MKLLGEESGSRAFFWPRGGGLGEISEISQAVAPQHGMRPDELLGLLAVAVLWGATNPWLKRASAGACAVCVVHVLLLLCATCLF